MVCCQEVLDLVSSYSDLLGAVVTLLDRSCNLETTCILPSHVATAEIVAVKIAPHVTCHVSKDLPSCVNKGRVWPPEGQD